MSWLEATVLGLVQGLGEFLPISSSAHLIIVSFFFERHSISLAANVALHLGTLGAVLIYFWSDWINMFSAAIKRFRGQDNDPEAFRLFTFLALGSLPAGVLGFSLKTLIETHLHHPLVVVAPLALVGICLYWVDQRARKNLDLSTLTIPKVLFIGTMQALALIPGVSRSGSTIIGGRLLGLSREQAARFSFLLGTPAMMGAALIEMRHIRTVFDDPTFFIGVIVSFVSGCLAIKFFLSFLRSYGFGVFAFYRVALAGCVLYLYWS